MADLSLSGLASGMDTSSIIEQLVQIESQPIANYQEEISELEQTQGAWRDINSRLDKLENVTTDLKIKGTYNSNTASSSNEDVATASASNGSNEGNYFLTVQSTAKAQRIFGEQIDESSSFSADTITLNNTDVEISSSDTLSDISNKINEADAGVRASIVDRRLVLETTDTGEENALDPTDNTSIADQNGILESLGILNGDTIVNEAQAASNAVVDINGITGIESSTNTFSEAVEGVTFNIDPEAEAGSFTSISVSKDTGKAVDAVKSFVDQYNSVMNFIDGKTEYDEDEKAGEILQGDGTASRLQMRLRELVTSQVKDDGDYKALSSVGVEVDRDGVMSFDTTKFEAALRDSPEEVMDLFRADSESDGFDGMAVRMDSYLNQLLQTNTGVIPRRIDFYNNQIDGLNDSIEDVGRKVEMTRERYVQQFTAMEEAVSEMQEQQSWMMSQLQGMGGSSNLMSSMM